MKPIRSFLNYPGNKYCLLSQIFPLFPHDNVSTLIDLFCGSAVVSLNFQGCESVIANDNNPHLIKLLHSISQQQYPEFRDRILHVIENYNLSNTEAHGYGYYQADSSKGLADANRTAFNRMRSDYNRGSSGEYNDIDLLYTLIVFGYNNQIRFNRNGHFNNPVGKRDFNQRMQTKLHDFIQTSQQKRIQFTSDDFINVSLPGRDAFVYADPPYSLTTAVYNDPQSWSYKKDQQLFDYLDSINERGSRFALSNVFSIKGRTNFNLIKWAQKYQVHHLSMSYSNSSYNTVRSGITDEVLITNY